MPLVLRDITTFPLHDEAPSRSPSNDDDSTYHRLEIHHLDGGVVLSACLALCDYSTFEKARRDLGIVSVSVRLGSFAICPAQTFAGRDDGYG